jgi:hypothetical protein
MGVVTPHALGRQQKFFAKAESTFNTFAKPAATDALKVLKSEMSFRQDRKDRIDARQSRSVLERITGRKECTWSLDKYVLPNGSAGTAPDDGPLWKALLGVETVNGGSSVVYTPSASQTALGSLTLQRHMSDVVQEAVTGAWVESATVKMSGGDEPKVTFSGGAADHVHTGAAVLEVIANAGAADITLTLATVANVQIGSIVAVGADDNSSAGYQITSVNTATGVCGVSPVLAVGAADEANVLPFAPSETTAGSPIAGTLGSITIDSVSALITDAEVTIKNNIKPITDEAFEDNASDYVCGYREVTGVLGLRGRRDFFIHVGKSKLFGAKDLVIICGSTAGARLKIDIDYAEFEFSPVDVPESDEVMFKIPFKALGNSAGENEVSVTFY